MQILSSHPSYRTARVRVWSHYSRGYRFVAPLRRLASFNLRTLTIDVLRNQCSVERESWDTFYTFGTLTVAIIRK